MTTPTPTTFLVAAMGVEVVDHQLRCARVHHLRAAQLASAREPVLTADCHITFALRSSPAPGSLS